MHMTKKLAVGESTWTDPDDAPELTADWMARAEIRECDKLMRRGRPKLDVTKKLVSLRIDQDVLQAFRDTGPGWQSKVNAALRKAAPKRKAG
jgi:uncharacterized protein (DUF4415 family)